MKKIIILQIPNAGNNGSAMMVINTVDHFQSHLKNDCEFICDFSSNEDMARISAELSPAASITKLTIPAYKQGIIRAMSLLNRLRWIRKLSRTIAEEKPHAVLALGGDDFSEYYSGARIIFKFLLMHQLSKKTPVYLIGQTIGPFRSWRIPAFRHLMSRCRIITRDAPSLTYCKNVLKHKQCKKSHDLAWSDLPKQTSELAIKITARYGLNKNGYVVLTPSSLVSHYTSDEYNYFIFWQKLIRGLQQRGHKIVLMPHVFADAERDDRWAISEICKRLPKTSDIIVITEKLLPSECRAILSACYYSISCRMHASVSTYQTGKPGIALSYSTKYAGVIGDDLKLPELVINATGDDIWKNGLADQVLQKASYVEEHYDALNDRIAARTAKIKQNLSVMMNELSAEIIKNNGNKLSA